MRVLLKYFSALRDITGGAREEVAFEGPVTVSDLLMWFFKKYPRAEAFREELVVLVNGRAVEGSYILKDGDEVALMPPVSGGGIITNDISVDGEIRDIIEKSVAQGGGGVVIFVGFVKGVVDNAAVNVLEYEAYEPYADQKIKEIEEWARSQEGVLDARVYHKVGSLKPGDTTIYVFVSAVNRDVAFRVARDALERVKHEVPIFKLERRSDGEFWVVGDGRRIPRSPQP